MFFVGEQPGDQEDRAGEPFVGPAGKLLRTKLGEVVIATVYPSSILRASGDDMRRQQLLAFRADLFAVAAALEQIAPSS